MTRDKSSCPHAAIRPNLCLAPSRCHTTELPEPGPGAWLGLFPSPWGSPRSEGKQGVLNLQRSCECSVLQSHRGRSSNTCTRKSSVWISWFSGWIPRLESEGQLGTRGWLGNTPFSADNHHQLHGCPCPFLPSTWLPIRSHGSHVHQPPSSPCCCSAAPLDTMETFGSTTHISPRGL